MSVNITGTGLTKISEHWSKSIIDLAVMSGRQALSESDISPDMIIIGNMLSSYASNQENLGSIISEKLGLQGTTTFKIESSSCSGAMAVHVANNILSGKDRGTSGINSILVIGVEKMSDLSPSQLVQAISLGESYEYLQFFGVGMTSLYALFSRLYMDHYNISKDDLSYFPALSHKNSVSCKHAQFNREFSVESISKSPIISSPLSLLDCSPIGDGSAAVVLTALESSNNSDSTNVKILSSSASNSTVNFFERSDMLKFYATEQCISKALSESQIKLSDIDLIEVHDVVPAITANILESLGFSKPGKAVSDVISGKYNLNSRPFLSTSGGLKARGNPLSATGIYQIIEITRQLQNKSDNNINNTHIGLSQNMSGIDSNSVIHILGVVN